MSETLITPAARWSVRLQRAWARIPAGFVLNGVEPAGPPPPDLAAALRRSLTGLITSHTDADGQVDYPGLAASQEFRDYLALAASLRHFDPAALPGETDRKTFWLNLYNVLILHAVVTLRLGQNSGRGWFERAAYDVGGFRFSANDIEHGVLRANHAHLLALGPQFRAGDPRLVYSLRTLDPRVHFALNCAARSCPPIRVYTPDQLDAQLDLATASFLHDGQLTVDRATMRVGLSRLFQYYGPDFGGGMLGIGRVRLVRFAARFVPDQSLGAFLDAEAHRLAVHFLPYDWSLNAYDPNRTALAT